MKDSTKEYLMAGALTAWGVVKGVAMQSMSRSSASITASNHMTARSVQSHWDKAGALREKEKEAEQVQVDEGFYLPSAHFTDSKGSFIEGGIWRKRSTDGTRVLLYKQRGQEEERHWFKWEEIKKYRLK